ncbi:hypothetical protein DFH11DRAFT_1818258 [Phellopilus nigrolimitatus]|nr:hypothetical protein DFH11DRAFT_1818258 [Phellopilus nigrolimitatus]
MPIARAAPRNVARRHDIARPTGATGGSSRNATQIICESYKEKGNQRLFQANTKPLQLVGGAQFFSKKVLFDRVIGFAKFSEFLIVAESLDLQASLDGKNFATGVFPPILRPQKHAYTILQSSTKSVFMHLTTSEFPNNVNRNDRGFVDFEKMISLDGIAPINVITNTENTAITRRKELSSRITHNDGGSWKPLTPPKTDALGQPYACTSTACSLQIHSVPGLLMAVGNVGGTLAPYTESDTFLSRDTGFSWQEIHKDAHLWELGDSVSILVIVSDKEPTDRVLFSTDEGIIWHEYTFATQDKVRVNAIVTVPKDTSRRVILLGYYPRSMSSAVAIHLDFSSLTRKQCILDQSNPINDDFEYWSPAEEHQERCLFGRRTVYHRRIRDMQCYIGDQEKIEEKIIENCVYTDTDLEW